MKEDQIITLCQKLAGKFKTPQHRDDLIGEGILACYEILAEDPDPHPAKLWRAALRRMHDYVNLDTAPVSVPKSDTARKVARGTGDITGNYSEAGILNLRAALEGEVVSLDDFMVSHPDVADEYEKREFEAYVMTIAVTTLTKRELYILRQRYFEDKSQEDLAEELEVSQRTISSWETAMLQKILDKM